MYVLLSLQEFASQPSTTITLGVMVLDLQIEVAQIS